MTTTPKEATMRTRLERAIDRRIAKAEAKVRKLGDSDD